MASGLLIAFWTAQDYIPASSTTRRATPDAFTDGSTPAQSFPTLDFDPGATTEFADFEGYCPGNYDGGGFTVYILFSSDATTGNVKWDGFFKSVSDDADDLDTKAFASAQSVTIATASAAGEVQYASKAFTDGAQIDSIAADELFFFRLERDSADAADTMNSNDAELIAIAIVET